MYENELYPAEVAEVMRQVLDGAWSGPDPEKHIDALISDFHRRLPDKAAWAGRIVQAVKALGCLDCVYARLNLECLLDPDTGTQITIRYNRQRKLPGENHGICACPMCQPTLALPPRPESRHISGRPPAPPAGDRAAPKIDNEQPEIPEIELPDESGYDALDAVGTGLYAAEAVLEDEPPKPSLSAERKIETLELIRRTGYQVLDDREAAYDRLAKLLRSRSLEQSIISRLVYLMLFEVLRGHGASTIVSRIQPKGLLR